MVGLSPTMPHSAAGIRTLPPMSVPSANGTQPEATAAPDPPDDPPGVREISQGLRVMPHSGESVNPEVANSGVFVLPTIMAPAVSSRSTSTGFQSGTQFCSSFEPRVVSLPLVGVKSLIAMGMPSSGRALPAANAFSATLAFSNASSG